jgi:hypothetical protein
MAASTGDAAQASRSQPEQTPADFPNRAGQVIRSRYELREAIGRGGMAIVYRATDLASGSDLALKQLVLGAGENDSMFASLFEREFRTLAQLSHPRIIEVYDFGVDECGPFYTMELLEGGDLRQRAPLAWRDACIMAYDICSSLALIHSRRLVHRDVTPSNIRFTREAQAKLIDFGAMVPMGAGSAVVGTLHFMAPEVALRSNLDARADLFSLGATLYYSLTRRVPYPGRDLTSVARAWVTAPVPPSQSVEAIPEALDTLVLALLGIEPAARPRTAFEVMQRLAALSGLRHSEPPQVSRAYLSTPVMVGRDPAVQRITSEMRAALAEGGRSVLVLGTAGMGRSSLLDASVLRAKTLGLRVLRAHGNATSGGAFRALECLAKELLEHSPDLALTAARAEDAVGILFESAAAGSAADAGEPSRPRLRDFAAAKVPRYELGTALLRWLRRVADQLPFAIAIDDVHRIDEPSAALIAALVSQIREQRMFVIATAESNAEPLDRLAFDVIAKHSTPIVLEPLSRTDNQSLFESIFGDVQNIRIVSDGIHAIARGNPRDAIDIAQHLIDRGRLRYESGRWTLPSRLDADDLPSDAREAIQARLGILSPLARFFAETQALATYKAFTRDDYVKVCPQADADQIDIAISELVAQQIVTSDGRVYYLSHQAWRSALIRPLTGEQQAERHRALLPLYERRLRLGVVHHALLGGLENRALDELAQILPGLPEATNFYELTDLSALEVAATFERALEAAQRIGRSELELNHLRRWLASLSVVSDDKYYFRVAAEWLERLKHDSGYTLWEQLAHVPDPGERLALAMRNTAERYAATPEGERVYRPDEAIRGLAHYVGISLAIGSSRLELAITESLPALLEPFAPITPLVEVIWQNAIAARESSCRAQWESAHARWSKVYERLAALADAEPQFVGVFQRAVAYALGANEATMGIASAAQWADQLDDDPVQRVNGLYIRRSARLQVGDLEGAEQCRRQAEILTLQTRARQMFAHLHWVELMACGMARDLTGVKQCLDRIGVLATRSPGWIPYVRLAEGLLGLCRDNLDAACNAFADGVALTAPPSDEPYRVPAAWCLCMAGYLEALIGLGKPMEARSNGEAAIATCEKLDVGVGSHGIALALALAEAKLGDVPRAISRVDGVIRRQSELGVTGLQLGASYETRARIAIVSMDQDAFDQYAELAAREYRHGSGSALVARFERLMHEGLALTRGALSARSDFQSATFVRSEGRALAATSAQVSEILKGASGPEERALRSVRMLCQATEATFGYLYLLEEDGPRLAASYPACEPPQGLDAFVRDYAEHLLQDDSETAVVTGDALDFSNQQTAFDALDGLRYSPIDLFSVKDDGTRYVAVAALALGEHGRTVTYEIGLALGTELIRAGDARGLRPG